MTPAAPLRWRRRIAAGSLAVGIAGATIGGLGLALEPTASASAPVSAGLEAGPLDDPSASAAAPASSAPAPIVSIPVAPTTAAAQPTEAATQQVTSAPTQAVTTAPLTQVTATSRATPVATKTKLRTATPTTRATSTSHYVPPVTSYSGTSTTQTFYGGNPTNDLPAGVNATGQPAVVETVKPGTSADPVYAEAATGVSTKRRYVDVQGVSVNEVLGYAAIAGALVGVIGGAGLWFTRGAR